MADRGARWSEESDRWALLWVAAGATLWGTDTVLRRPLAWSWSSLHVVLLEHWVLAMALLPLAWRSRLQWMALKPIQWGALFGVSWGGSALATVCFTEAIRFGNPTTAVLLQKTQPLFAALLARALLIERLGGRFWGCLAVALAAAWLVSFGAAVPWLGPVEARPALLALTAAALWGGSTVLGRYLTDTLAPAVLVALRVQLAVPLLTALPWLRDDNLIGKMDPGQALSLLLLALVPGLAALLLYYRGLSRTSASLAAIVELCFPATATLLNWVFLDARISPEQLAGFALLWGVISYMERSSHP